MAPMNRRTKLLTLDQNTDVILPRMLVVFQKLLTSSAYRKIFEDVKLGNFADHLIGLSVQFGASVNCHQLTSP